MFRCAASNVSSEVHGHVGLDILFTAYKVYSCWVWLRAKKWRCRSGTVASNRDALESYLQSACVQPRIFKHT